MKRHALLNAALLPLRIALPHETVNRLGLQSLRDERYALVMQHARGRLLDIGCGNNELAKRYGHDSVGVDVFDFGGGAMIVRDTAQLPFRDASFTSVSFVASLNHIPHRDAVLAEAHRLLCDRGLVLITMLSPFVGKVRHRLARWDEDQTERGIRKEGELMGMSQRALIGMVEGHGFRLLRRVRFVLWINSLYVFERR
jgi:SAM-dependent methyltransferase